MAKKYLNRPALVDGKLIHAGTDVSDLPEGNLQSLEERGYLSAEPPKYAESTRVDRSAATGAGAEPAEPAAKPKRQSKKPAAAAPPADNPAPASDAASPPSGTADATAMDPVPFGDDYALAAFEPDVEERPVNASGEELDEELPKATVETLAAKGLLTIGDVRRFLAGGGSLQTLGIGRNVAKRLERIVAAIAE